METEQMTPQEIITNYKDDIMKLAAYLPWLEEKSGKRVADTYNQDDISSNSISFPVYDSNLLRFVKEVKETKFIDINYRYGCLRYRLRTVADEREFIPKVSIQQLNALGAILSKYVLGGQTKARLWSDAMNEGIFLDVVTKMKELLDFWTATKN